jgi:membrane-bound metal-dependent hydrolase YbcI (DUF457 family)
MAGYRQHLMFSSALGVGYGAVGLVVGGAGAWGQALLGAGVTALGGLLPDLDSDSGVPVRELFGVAAVVTPILLAPHLMNELPLEQALALLAGTYLVIRYGVSRLFKRYTVHRGIFHSIPALLIAGLALFLVYPSPNPWVRVYMAGGVMVGFLSHLVLDEVYSVDFMGGTPRLNKYAGSALALWSPSWSVTVAAYAILLVLAGLALWSWPGGGG